MDNDNIMESGLSRRQMLIGTGVLAAGYTVGQLATGATDAFGNPTAIDKGACNPGTTGLPWPAAWADEATVEAAAMTAAFRGHNQFRAGGG